MKKGLITALVILVCIALSWIIDCGIIKLITLCFGLEFSWAIATGIWLILWLVGSACKNIKG